MTPFKVEYPRYPQVRPLDDTDRNILRDLADEADQDRGFHWEPDTNKEARGDA